MLHDEFRTHRVTVARMAASGGRVSDGAGGWVEAPTDAGTVDGSLTPQYVIETKAGTAERAEARWQFMCDDGTDLVRDDVVTVTAIRRRDDWEAVTAGQRYTVVSVGEYVERFAGIGTVVAQLEEVQVGR